MQEKRPFQYNRLIKEMLAAKIQINSSFSLRSFAHKLEISPSQLSKVINKKAKLSDSLATKISGVLFSTSKNRSLFLDYVKVGNREASKEAAQMEEYFYFKLTNPNQFLLNPKELACLSDWSVVACFNSFALATPPSNLSELSLCLGISPKEAEWALSQLEISGFVFKKSGWYERSVKHMWGASTTPSPAIRNLHKQFISKALYAIDSQSMERRYLRAKTIGIKQEALPKIRELIEIFCVEIDKIEAETGDSADEIYQINLQCFDLLNQKPARKKNAS